MNAPDFVGAPTIVPPVDGKIAIDYKLNLPDQALTDQSVITWYRLDNNNWDSPTTVSVSRLNVPEKFYKLEPIDAGKYIGVEIKPKHDVSSAGEAVKIIYNTQITSGNIKMPFEIHTDYRNLPIEYSTSIKPGYWTIQNASPTANQLTDWRKSGYKLGSEAMIAAFAPSTTVSGWEFTNAGLDGAASTEDVVKYGLYMTKKGAHIFYTPVTSSDYMKIKMNLNPEKMAGQGFGSAGQYLDILIKFDIQLQRGFALRMLRISQGGKSVMFYLVEYKEDGTVVPICDPVWSSAMISDCLITLTADNSTGKLIAHVESTTPQSASAITEWTDHPSQKVVDMQADMTPNSYGGFGIFDIGSESAKNRHLFRSLDVVWVKAYSVAIGSFTGGSVSANKSEDLSAGETVTLNIEPFTGYKLKSISAYKTGDAGTLVELTGTGNSRTFTMPAYDVKVFAEFTAESTGLLDIDKNDLLVSAQLYNLQGIQLNKPDQHGIYIIKENYQSGKLKTKKIHLNQN
jgi:hypothetical protein